MIFEEELERKRERLTLPYVTYILLTIVSQMEYVHNTDLSGKVTSPEKRETRM